MTRSLFVLLVAAAVPGSLVAGCAPTRSADASPARASAASAPNAAAASAASEAPPAAVGAKVYAKPSEAELTARLTPLQFEVTQRAATEPPFQNAYWNNHEAGLYVDVATGEPLFSSRDKFESGTGWPSFTRPVDGGHVVEHHDFSLGMARTEVLSKAGASHLGHVFDDGPAPDNLRYCINSASLRFVPASRLAAEGYGAYAPSFGLEAPKQVAPSAAASNSCTLPPPGKAPGCKATLETAIFAPAPGDDTRAKTPGILDLARGHEGAEPAVEVTYDPAKLTYEALLTAWTSGRPAARVYARNDAQKQAAAAKALKPADAVPFRRE